MQLSLLLILQFSTQKNRQETPSRPKFNIAVLPFKNKMSANFNYAAGQVQQMTVSKV